MALPRQIQIATVSLVALIALGALAYLNQPEAEAAVQSTDNAYVRADFTVVAPQVSGRVAAVLVQDNKVVAGRHAAGHPRRPRLRGRARQRTRPGAEQRGRHRQPAGAAGAAAERHPRGTGQCGGRRCRAQAARADTARYRNLPPTAPARCRPCSRPKRGSPSSRPAATGTPPRTRPRGSSWRSCGPTCRRRAPCWRRPAPRRPPPN